MAFVKSPKMNKMKLDCDTAAESFYNVPEWNTENMELYEFAGQQPDTKDYGKFSWQWERKWCSFPLYFKLAVETEGLLDLNLQMNM